MAAPSVPVVTGIAITSSSMPISPATTATAAPRGPEPMPALLSALAARGFPKGLAKLLWATPAAFPTRIWIVDNSGSMSTGDGRRRARDSHGKAKMLKCTRWAELAETVRTVAQLATHLGARTDFHLLNRNSAGQFLTVAGGDAGGSVITAAGESGDLAALDRLLSPSPLGSTPLTEAVAAIISMIEPVSEKLRSLGQQAVVVIATDGLPNSPPAFIEALRQLQRLPVWVVVRLCTSDDSIVDYWSELDKSLEAPLEVLDDWAGEAEEIYKVNPWLVYSDALHQAREFGVRDKVFDLLDETPLLPSQIKQMCELLFGLEPTALPEPELDPKAFSKALQEVLKSVPPAHDPRTGNAKPWIDTKHVSKRLSSRQSDGCIIA